MSSECLLVTSLIFANFHLPILTSMSKWSNCLKLKSYGWVYMKLVLIYLMVMLVKHLKYLDSLSPS